MAGIYIHIPFCKQACHYCNFYFSVSKGNKNRFIQSLLHEIDLTKDYLAGEPIATIYIGGGTPSQLQTDELKTILEKLHRVYDLSQLSEMTIEANPDDLTTEKVTELSTLRSIGLNRFSIGIQSFREEDLKYMNRAHRAEEAVQSVKRVQEAGFENITIDLIYGTPTMNDEQWHENLSKAFALEVPHISCYGLTVEAKTTLERKIKKGKCLRVDENQSATQFSILMNEMRANGYEQYEISNFAKPGHHAIHNTNYWLGKKYLGLGPSAHSYNRDERRWNVSNIIGYAESIEKGELPFEEERLSAAQKVNEKIMTSLRTKWGLNVAECGEEFTRQILEALQPIEPTYFTFENKTITLTDKGKLFADAIAAKLFV